MTTDQDSDRRTAATTPAPDTEPGDRDTQPPDPIAEAGASRALQTMLPGKPDWWEGSFFQSVFNRIEEAADKIAGKEGADADRHQAVIDEIVKADRNQSRNYEMLRDQIRHLKESDRNQDAKIAALEATVSRLETEVASIKSTLAELKNGTASKAPAPPG